MNLLFICDDYLLICCVDFPTTDKFKVVDMFLMFVGRLEANFLKDGLMS